MSESGARGQPIETQLRFVTDLVDHGAAVDGQVIRIADATWAVHGRIPVDGDVIIAEFDDPDAASAVIDRLWQPRPLTLGARTT
jgi:hypothetical protein